jgi:hypothetical protein
MLGVMVWRRVVGGVALAVLLGGVASCGGKPAAPIDVVSDTDRDRAAILAKDPVLATAVLVPTVTPGRVHSAKLGWDRTEVTARIFEQRTGPNGTDLTPTEVEHQLAAVLTKLRAGGWSVHWALCLPKPPSLEDLFNDPTMLPEPVATTPPPGPSPSPTPTPSVSPSPGATGVPKTPALTGHLPSDIEPVDGYQWAVFAYRISAGVSYWAELSAGIVTAQEAYIDVVLRAPEDRDPADLFTTAPPALAAGTTCAEDGRATTKIQEDGLPILVRDWYPFPTQSHVPDPGRL